MIYSGTYYHVTCDVCGRDEEDLGTACQVLYLERGEAAEMWADNDCGPEVAPDGKALCWECADKAQAGETNE